MTRFVNNVLSHSPRIARILLIPPRMWIAARYQSRTFANIFRWGLSSKETTNFTYELTNANRAYLASFISIVTGCEKEQVSFYVQELEQDQHLRHYLHDAIRQSQFCYKADTEPRYGRRMGWYACVRIKKPNIVVETGTDKGLGSVIIAAALAKNSQEGSPGRLYTIDICSSAGWLLQHPYSEFVKILYGDSLHVLSDFQETINIFINDSDHSAAHEYAEYKLVEEKLAPEGLVIGDNSHCTTKLLQFAEETSRKFLFFKEEPHNHWYPGGGIGFAFR